MSVIQNKTQRVKVRRDWINIIFFALTPLLAVVGVSWNISRGGPHPATLAFAVIMLYASGMSITAGYHRLFAHRAYQTVWPVRLFFVLFGAAAFQGSALWWSAEHRVHHRYEDTDKDPYPIHKGFWYAHIGWLLEKREDASMDHVKELLRDPMLVWQQRFYFFIAGIMSFLFPMAVAALWGDPWGGLIYVGLLRLVVNHHATFCINSLCHWIGKKTYNDQMTARDSWVTALFTYGEGYHNFHHYFQGDYRNGIRAFHWDPTKWLISGMARVGLAHRLKRTSTERILAARVVQDQQTYWNQLSVCSETVKARAHELLEQSKIQLQEAQARFLRLREEYQSLRHKKIGQMNASLRTLKTELRAAKRELRIAWLDWSLLIKDPLAVLGHVTI